MRLPPTITSRSNTRAKILRAASNGQAAQPGDLLAIEGENLIAEALRSGLRFDSIFLREGSEAVIERPSLRSLAADNWSVLSKDVFESAVDTASPQGIAALVPLPELPAMDFANSSGPVLAIESLQDPGNLGTLLRSAEAFGIRQIFTTQDTVNRWNPKVVRASAGSVFRVPVVRAPLASVKEFLAPFGYRFFAAVVQAKGTIPVTDADLSGACALMLGNEGAGLSAQAIALADTRINIPCAVESLNAAIAGSTLMYEAMRQNLRRNAEGTA